MKMKCAKCREEYDSETYPCSCPKCYPKPTGYGKRLNQLSAEEMAWWHKNSFRPTAGKSYLCRRGCKEHGTVTGKVYVFDGSNLKHYSSRNVTMLLNGYNTLRQAYAFEETEAVLEPAKTQKSATAPTRTVARKMDSEITTTLRAQDDGAVRCTVGLGRVERPELTACIECGENAPEHGTICNECREARMYD